MFLNKKGLTLFVLLFYFTTNAQSSKNNFEFGILGNIGFLHAGYTRSIINFNDFSVNSGAKIGYVPGSGDEESSTIQKTSVPTFLHLNIPAEILWKFHELNNVGIGVSYSKILAFVDEYSTSPKSNYNRILGEISYGHIIGWDNNSDTTTWVKVYFCPFIYDDHANDVDNIPVRISFIYNF